MLNSTKMTSGEVFSIICLLLKFYSVIDCRAGAFQFVYLNSESVLPMPYQVQIIKKNYGIICWRYPQPRQMTSIRIYPVPMPVSSIYLGPIGFIIYVLFGF